MIKTLSVKTKIALILALLVLSLVLLALWIIPNVLSIRLGKGDLAWLLVMLFTGGVFIGGVALWLINRLILYPLAGLNAEFTRICADGNFRHRINPSGSSEVMQLVQTLNHSLAGFENVISEHGRDWEQLQQELEKWEKMEGALEQERHLLRTVIDNLPDQIFAKDRDCRFMLNNLSDAHIIGVDNPEDLVGKSDYDFYPPELAAAYQADDRHVIEMGQVMNYREEPSRDPNGNLRWVLTTKVPLKDAQGNVIGIVGIGRDITERKLAELALQEARNQLEIRVDQRTAELREINIRLEQELKRRKEAENALLEERSLLARRVEERTAELSIANAELAKAARMKDAFLASMSHELRTPLNAILSISETLQEEIYGPLNEKQMKSVRSVEESGRHLLALINDILDLSKIGAGKLELLIDVVSVSSLCMASIQLVSEQARKKQITLDYAGDPLATTLQADERRLKQMLVNLLSNAVKFTPTGGNVGLVVEADGEKGTINFTVWDTGIGIKRENLSNLFQPFVQLDNSLARQYEGTGLGLALVYRMAEMHGGGVSVESELGKGSKFTVSLPWQREKIEVDLAQSLSESRETRLNIRHALVIEDSPTAGAQITRYLSEIGIETLIYSRGDGAVEQVRMIKPDIIILDIQLPNISGWEILQDLKADDYAKSIPVIIVSVVDDRSKGINLGAAGYLVKPVSRSQLQQVIYRCSIEDGFVGKCFDKDYLDLGGTKHTILVADDNEASLNIVYDYLTAKDYHVVIARNGAEAIARAWEENPELILMDIQMPGVDGLEATRRLRTDDRMKSIPIIALTALAMPDDREHCIQAGANEYMSKPVSLKKLVEMIENFLARREYEQANHHSNS